MTSRASICSVTRIDPMLEVINDPTLPAIIMEIKVGANSKMIDCLVAKATNSLGMIGSVKFNAVCRVITPPTKKPMKLTIPKELMTKSSISLNINSLKTSPFVKPLKVRLSIKK